ncbi:MAG: hypothetical protein AB1476_00095 [Candidatus Hadarchaeota archaeon]
MFKPSGNKIFQAEPSFKMEKLWKTRKWMKKKKYPLVAVLVVVIVFIGVWAATRPVPPPPPVYPTARIRGPVSPVAQKRPLIPFPISKGAWSGVENIYLMKHGIYNAGENLADNSQRWENVISESGQVVEVLAGNIFDIVVAARVIAPDNIVYLRKENMKVWLSVSGSFAIPYSYAPDEREYVFDASGYGTAAGYMRVNAVWDNDGEGYELPAWGELVIDNLVLGLDVGYTV